MPRYITLLKHPFSVQPFQYSSRRKGAKAMRHAGRAIKNWRHRAIFIDFWKTKLTSSDEDKESSRRGKAPESFLKPASNTKHPEKVALQRPSIPELLSGTFTIFCFVIFVYIKMLLFEIRSQETISQLETYAALSLIVGITFFVTFITSMVFRKLFPGEM
jgi:hypothetical protein